MNIQLNNLIKETNSTLTSSKNKYSFFGLSQNDIKICNNAINVLKKLQLLIDANIEEPSYTNQRGRYA